MSKRPSRTASTTLEMGQARPRFDEAAEMIMRGLEAGYVENDSPTSRIEWTSNIASLARLVERARPAP